MSAEEVRLVLAEIQNYFNTRVMTVSIVRRGESAKGKVLEIDDSSIQVQLKDSRYRFMRLDTDPLDYIEITNKRLKVLSF